MAKTVMLAILSILLVCCIILQPDVSFQASLKGLSIWWDIVFPGLLPYFVLYEIMLAFGLAHGLGALLQPVASRLLRMPGEAVIGLAAGWMGGYPAGAEQVARLCREGRLNNSQGQHLLALSHMPNPLFMIVIVGASFLQTPTAGLIVAAGVWLSALWLLLLSSIWPQFPHTKPHNQQPAPARPHPRHGLLAAAAFAMKTGRESDGRSFGRVLGESVTASVQRLMIVGGFMIVASVLARLAEPLLLPLSNMGFPFVGQVLFEGHLGAYAASLWNLPGAGLPLICAAIAAAVSWTGISGILQAGYSIGGTGLKLIPFMMYRLNHAVHAFLVTLLLWGPAGKLFSMLVPDGGFPVLAEGTTRLSSHGPLSEAQAFTAVTMPTLWPYSAAIFVGGAVLLCGLYFLFKWRPVGRTEI
jgi:sporulation integral membrane protein YlbJ